MIFCDRMSLLVLMLGRGVALSDRELDEESAIIEAQGGIRASLIDQYSHGSGSEELEEKSAKRSCWSWPDCDT